ncbi:ATP-binding cassette domain-containing protein [Patulibacter sp.]|uniref:ATP-binding cassette domain-containing protein n=1 Tax=Patulibacter sp. TaxID=1912859 RepID=UPI00271CB6E5|nr:ATP-binding cassette domain-containing protein [Patulibacter sp.]MDO9408002.1 ATP-binding cassette domain-containing protein [Patulibacter sp.]
MSVASVADTPAPDARREPSAPPRPAPAIVLDGLVRRRGERVVLRDVSVIVPAGATVALLGPNGAGKSTLLRVLAGLMRPMGGVCRVLGHELPAGRHDLRGRVGYLAHEPMLYRDLTVRENLTHRARLLRVADVPGRVRELLEATDLVRRADFPVHALSRGLTQRTTAAATLLADPELLLLDEPLANLDPSASARLGDLLGPRPAVPAPASPASGPPARPARTRVIAGHDPEAALAESDIVVGLRDGAVTLLATPDTVTPAQVTALYA